MRQVFVASPYRGDVSANTEYAIKCGQDCIRREEAPIIPHLYLTQILNDDVPAERLQGMRIGHAHLANCDAIAVYLDRGMSDGMRDDLMMARHYGVTIEERRLYPESPEELDPELNRAFFMDGRDVA